MEREGERVSSKMFSAKLTAIACGMLTTSVVDFMGREIIGTFAP